MSEKEVLEELRDIKKLLVLQLIALKVRQDEIAEILETQQSHISEDFKATKLIKRMKRGEKNAKKEN